MDFESIMTEMKSKFGDKFDVAAVKEHFKDVDLSKFSMTDIMEKVKSIGLGDLDGDGVKESAFEEIKGKISSLFGGK